MNYQVIIPLEFPLTAIQFSTLWTLFFLLHRPESKTKSTVLICYMVIWRPLHIIISIVLTLSTPTKVVLEILAFLVLVFLAGGKKRAAFITAIYLWDMGLLSDVIFSCLFTGISGSLSMTNPVILYYETSISQITMFLWAIFYYFLMRAMTEETLKRVPLRFWLITLLTPFIGAIALFTIINPLKSQLEAGFNNFIYCGIFGIVLLILNLFIFFLYIKLITGYQAKILAVELAEIPPIYSQVNGLSEAFIKKYDLSKRQVEVTVALLQGKSNKEIAKALDIEVNTVQVHLQNVYRKTGAPGRYALMALIGKIKIYSN